MKTQQHTPGPWFVDGFDLMSIIKEVAKGVYVHIANCRYARGDLDDIETLNMDIANARLIACAPDLLREVKECSRILFENCDCDECPPCRTRLRINKLIEKMKGLEYEKK